MGRESRDGVVPPLSRARNAERMRKARAAKKGDPMTEEQKPPTEIEAVLWDGKNVLAIDTFLVSQDLELTWELETGRSVVIAWGSSTLTCEIGHWLFRGSDGSFGSCAPEAFESMYREEATEDEE